MSEERVGSGSGEVHTDLARDLSFFDITMIGVDAMIAAGIFVPTGLAAGQGGGYHRVPRRAVLATLSHDGERIRP